MAGAVAGCLGLPQIEMDALFHGPGWSVRPEFDADVARFVDGPGWVAEWQYEQVRGLLAGRAELVIWLDLRRRVVMAQVVRRTLCRRLRRVELWNGNREPRLRSFFTDPDHVVRGAWSTYDHARELVLALPSQCPGLIIVRLDSRRAARRWLAGPLAEARAGRPDTG